MTHDRKTTDQPTYYTTEQLGPKRALTPEGFLLCSEVPIARTGEMAYGPNETPLKVGADGKVTITRSADEIFKPESIASIAGKPVTDDHPPVDVDPTNWKYYTKGIVLNPRRGEGDTKDCLTADLLIYDHALIDDIQSGKREVSCGYNPEYFPLVNDSGEEIPGRGEQKNILYNHLALVEKGRCGPRCSIGDRKTVDKELNMSSSLREKIRSAFFAKDEKALDQALMEVPTPSEEKGQSPVVEIHNHIPTPPPEEKVEGERQRPEGGSSTENYGYDDAPPWFTKHKTDSDQRFKTLHDNLENLAKGLAEWIEGEKTEPEHQEGEPEEELEELAEEAPAGDGDKAKGAKDSIYLGDSFQVTLSNAEILAPGIKLPTYDKSAPPKKTLEIIAGVRRSALDLAYVRPEMRSVIENALGGRSLDTKTMKHGAIRTLFNAVAAVQREENKKRASDTSTNNRTITVPGTTLPVGGRIQTIADLNARNKELYKNQRR